MDLLREYRAKQDEERIKLGTKWQDYDRLFVKWDGRPMNNNTPYFWLKEFCEETISASVTFTPCDTSMHRLSSMRVWTQPLCRER